MGVSGRQSKSGMMTKQSRGHHMERAAIVFQRYDTGAHVGHTCWAHAWPRTGRTTHHRTTTYTARTTMPCSSVSRAAPGVRIRLGATVRDCSLIRPFWVGRASHSLQERCCMCPDAALICEVDTKIATHGPQAAKHKGAPQGPSGSSGKCVPSDARMSLMTASWVDIR